MNPQDNNPTTPAGDVGVASTDSASIAPPVDFTAGADSGLSMTDSLASAEDNLTSAGLAAVDSGPVAMGLDQIGASDPSATMDRPEAPLVPADPVPGSIGSATSGPALPDTTPAEVAPVSAEAAPAPVEAPVAPAMDTTAAPVVDATVAPVETAAPVAVAPAADAASAAGQVTPQAAPEIPGAIPVMDGAAVSNVAAAETPAQAPYNPFAPANGQAGVTSAALQPRTEKFSGKGGNGGSKMMTILFAVLSLILAVTTVIFLMLWQGALNSNKTTNDPVGGGVQEPAGSGNEGTDDGTLCIKSQFDEETGATGEERVRLFFENDVVKTITMGGTLVYPDEAIAEEALAQAQQSASFVQNMYGVDLAENLVRNGNELSFDITTDVNTLAEKTAQEATDCGTVSGIDEAPADCIGLDVETSMTIGGLRVENGAVLNPLRNDLIPAFELEGFTCN